VKLVLKLALLGLPLALVACSTLEGDKVDYKAATKATPLSVPPDLTQLPRDTRYLTPGSTVSATGYQNAAQGSAASAASAIAVAAYPGMRIEGVGSQRWLVVDQPAEKLWPLVKTFWEETGLTVVLEQATLGIMETDWAENRAKIPLDLFRRTLGKIFENLYSTGTLDKYRTRLERNAAGGTEIYISHRGMTEVYQDNDKTKTVWQPSAPDSEMEIEMLRRLMIKLGAPGQQADQQAAVVPRRTSRLENRDGQPVVLISEGFDRAWRRVGLTLDRTGFTVEDRDRSQGTYFVRYVEPTQPGQAEPGFFSRMFGASPKDKAPQKYRITVRGVGESSTVTVLNAEGAPEVSDNAQRILQVITDDLR